MDYDAGQRFHASAARFYFSREVSYSLVRWNDLWIWTSAPRGVCMQVASLSRNLKSIAGDPRHQMEKGLGKGVHLGWQRKKRLTLPSWQWLPASLFQFSSQLLDPLKWAWEAFIFILKGLGRLAFLKTGKTFAGFGRRFFLLLCIWV